MPIALLKQLSMNLNLTSKGNSMVFIILFIMATFLSCNKKKPLNAFEFEVDTSISLNSNEVIVANPIMYDVIIENHDKDDAWKTECLEGLDKKLLIDFLFSSVYNKKLKAYDFFSGVPLLPNDLAEIEKRDDFSRDKIGKILFYEKWLLDTVSFNLRKEVTDYIIGYHKTSADSSMILYKPVFRISAR